MTLTKIDLEVIKIAKQLENGLSKGYYSYFQEALNLSLRLSYLSSGQPEVNKILERVERLSIGIINPEPEINNRIVQRSLFFKAAATIMPFAIHLFQSPDKPNFNVISFIELEYDVRAIEDAFINNLINELEKKNIINVSPNKYLIISALNQLSICQTLTQESLNEVVITLNNYQPEYYDYREKHQIASQAYNDAMNGNLYEVKDNLFYRSSTGFGRPFFSSAEHLRNFAKQYSDEVLSHMETFIAHQCSVGIDENDIPLLPIDIARIMGHTKVVDEIENWQSLHPSDHAIEQAKLLDMIINRRLLRALEQAILNNQSQAVKIITNLTSIKHIIQSDYIMQSNLMLEAVKSGNLEIIRSIPIQNSTLAYPILEKLDKDGKSLLCISVEKGRKDIARFLLEKGADINRGCNNLEQTRIGMTAMHFAALIGDIAMIEFLLAKGADINAKYMNVIPSPDRITFTPQSTKTPLDIAKEAPNSAVAEYLIKKGGKISAYIISHTILIECGQKLGYPFDPVGLCGGITMRWLEATLNNSQNLFDRRLEQIANLNASLTADIILSDLEKDSDFKDSIVDIKAFYESLLLYQQPYMYSEIFAQHLNQINIQEISELAASDETIAKGGINTSYIQSNIYRSYIDIEKLLLELEKTIQHSGCNSPVGFRLSVHGEKFLHAIGITYSLDAGNHEKWQFMDIQTYPPCRGDANVIAKKIRDVMLVRGYCSVFAVTSVVLNKESNQQLLQNLSRVKTNVVSYNKDERELLLALASVYSDLSLIKKLVAEGTEVNILDVSGTFSPLMVSINHSFEVCEFLLENGANPNGVAYEKSFPLIQAIAINNIKIVKLLLEHKADPNQTIASGITPMFKAVCMNNIDAIKILLAHKANPNILLSDGSGPLFIAAQEGKYEIVKLLLENSETKMDLPFISSAESLRNFAQKRDENIVLNMNKFIEQKIESGIDAANIPVLPIEIAHIMRHENIVRLIKEQEVKLASNNKDIIDGQDEDIDDSIDKNNTLRLHK